MTKTASPQEGDGAWGSGSGTRALAAVQAFPGGHGQMTASGDSQLIGTSDLLWSNLNSRGSYRPGEETELLDITEMDAGRHKPRSPHIYIWACPTAPSIP